MSPMMPDEDDQPTLRIVPPFEPPQPRRVRRLRHSAQAEPPADDGRSPRRRVEVGSLAVSTGALGILLAALWIWWHDPTYPRAQTQSVTFMTLTSLVVVGLFASIVLAVKRTTTERTDTRFDTLDARLAVMAEAMDEAVSNSEANAESVKAVLRSVGFSLSEARREFDRGLTRVYTLVADALERGGFAPDADVSALRAEVEALEEKVRQNAMGYAAGWVDSALSSELGVSVGYDPDHPHLRVIKDGSPTSDNDPRHPSGRKP